VNACNVAVNAVTNLREDPPALYVHGSVMLFHADDEIVVEKVGPENGDLKTLVVELKVRVHDGPQRGVSRPFFYEERGDHVSEFERIAVRKHICTVESNGTATAIARVE